IEGKRMKLIFHRFWKTLSGIMISLTGFVAFLQSNTKTMLFCIIMILAGLFIVSVSEEKK
ncbi:unnamed protein product, partial [marine sediment metagenome]